MTVRPTAWRTAPNPDLLSGWVVARQEELDASHPIKLAAQVRRIITSKRSAPRMACTIADEEDPFDRVGGCWNGPPDQVRPGPHVGQKIDHHEKRVPSTVACANADEEEEEDPF